MVFLIVIKNNVMKDIKDIKIRDQELPNNPLYNTFVANPVILKKINMKIKLIILLKITTITDVIKINALIIPTDIEITLDIEATVEIIHKTIINQILDKDNSIDLQVHTHLDPDMTPTIKDRSPYRNNPNYRYNSRSRYRSRSQSQGNSFRRYGYPYRSPSRPRNYRSRSRTPSQNRQQNRKNQLELNLLL